MNVLKKIESKLHFQIIIALFAGALFPLGLAPLDFWPLTFVSVGLCWWLIAFNQAHLFKIGWFYGIGFFGTGVSWISASMSVADTPAIITFVLTSLFCISLGILFAIQFKLTRVLQTHSTLTKCLVFSAMWIFFEWIRSWMFTGFPWLYAGYALTDTWYAGFAPLIGVFGLSIILVTLAQFIAFSLYRKDLKQLSIAITATIFLSVSGYSLHKIQWVMPLESEIDTVVVQGNIDQKTKWQMKNIKPTFDLYVELSKPHFDADLIIWPEASITALRSKASDFTDLLQFYGTKTDTGFITGIISDVKKGEQLRYFNSAIGLGQASGEYHKQRMVPFGEYVPFASLLRPMLGFFNMPMSVLEPGDTSSDQLRFKTPGEQKATELGVGTLICYEIAYPSMARAAAKENSIILTLSNDAWFGLSFGPYQHLQIAQMRAMETGRPVIRATQDGVSAFINHKGVIENQADKQLQIAIRQIVKPMTGETPYLIFGHLWIIFIASLILLIPIWCSLKDRHIVMKK